MNAQKKCTYQDTAHRQCKLIQAGWTACWTVMHFVVFLSAGALEEFGGGASPYFPLSLLSFVNLILFELPRVPALAGDKEVLVLPLLCSFQALTAAAHVVHGEAERLVEEKVQRLDRPYEVFVAYTCRLQMGRCYVCLHTYIYHRTISTNIHNYLHVL